MLFRSKPVFVLTEDGLGTLDVMAFPLARSYGEVIEALDALLVEDHDFETLVVDSLDWLEPLIWAQVAREGGATAKAWVAHLKAFDAELGKSANADVKAIRASLAAGAAAVVDCVDFIVANAGKDVLGTFAGAVPFLKLMGVRPLTA